jgi:hypothetical protein
MSADTLGEEDEPWRWMKEKESENFPNARARERVSVCEPCAGNVLCLKSGISFFSSLRSADADVATTRNTLTLSPTIFHFFGFTQWMDIVLCAHECVADDSYEHTSERRKKVILRKMKLEKLSQMAFAERKEREQE